MFYASPALGVTPPGRFVTRTYRFGVDSWEPGACPGAFVTGTVAKWLTISETSAAIDVSPT